MGDPGLLQKIPVIPPCCFWVVLTLSRRLHWHQQFRSELSTDTLTFSDGCQIADRLRPAQRS